MNATVKRIVEVMFQDKPVNDELIALKDEVMNNCQERYDDMIARGLSEDEAIATVVESLKGMEEVIAERAAAAGGFDIADKECDDVEAALAFDGAAVSLIRINLRADDVAVEPSSDGMVHVIYDREEVKNLRVRLNGTTLDIDRDYNKTIADESRKAKPIEEWKSFGDFMDALSSKLAGIGRVFSSDGAEITVSVPAGCSIALEAHLTSGNLDVDGVELTALDADCMSGDVNVDLADGIAPKSINVKTASGDVDVSAHAASLSAATMSGDIDVYGTYDTVNLSSVSGDVDVEGSLRTANMKSVSGDVDLQADERLCKVDAKTTSGDVTIHVPASFSGRTAVTFNSVSGEVRSHLAPLCGPASLEICMNTVSGDIELNT